jgi:hypothetical protein
MLAIARGHDTGRHGATRGDTERHDEGMGGRASILVLGKDVLYVLYCVGYSTLFHDC